MYINSSAITTTKVQQQYNNKKNKITTQVKQQYNNYNNKYSKSTTITTTQEQQQ